MEEITWSHVPLFGVQQKQYSGLLRNSLSFVSLYNLSHKRGQVVVVRELEPFCFIMCSLKCMSE